MFTGLIEEIGQLTRIETRGAAARLAIRAARMSGDLAVGESVAVDGACLTVEATTGEGFLAFASPETLERTTLGDARPGRRVNLERAMRAGDRLGGHLVAGHVDARGRVLALEPRDESWWLSVEAPRLIVDVSTPKGSIAVDGISLTIVDVESDRFTVAVIPQTWNDTTLRDRGPGDAVNLESDMIGKYVARAVRLHLGEAPDADASRPPGSIYEMLLRDRRG